MRTSSHGLRGRCAYSPRSTTRISSRIDAASKGSESIIATLTEIAQSSKDPQVAMEALRQLSEIRKADVDAAKDAYIDD